MGWSELTKNKVLTVEDHVCDICGRVVPKGTPKILRYMGFFEGEFKLVYFCNWCEDHLSHFVFHLDDTVFDLNEILVSDIYWRQVGRYVQYAQHQRIYHRFNGNELTFYVFETDEIFHTATCPISRYDEQITPKPYISQTEYYVVDSTAVANTAENRNSEADNSDGIYVTIDNVRIPASQLRDALVDNITPIIHWDPF